MLRLLAVYALWTALWGCWRRQGSKSLGACCMSALCTSSFWLGRKLLLAQRRQALGTRSAHQATATAALPNVCTPGCPCNAGGPRQLGQLTSHRPRTCASLPDVGAGLLDDVHLGPLAVRVCA